MKLTPLRFDPKKSFVQLPILWFTVLFFVAIASIVAVIIARNTHLQFDPSAAGFNYFLSVFKFPLGLVALIIPVVALLAANHRSTQTSAQLIAASTQNLFSNYYKHSEEFSKHLGDRVSPKIIGNSSPRKLHSLLFPRAKEGEYVIDAKLSASIEKHLSFVVEHLTKVGSGGSVGTSVAAAELVFKRDIAGLGFPFPGMSGVTLKIDNEDVAVQNDLRAFFLEIKNRAYAFQAMLEFDHSYATTQSLAILCSIDLTVVPAIRTTQLQNASRFKPFPVPS